MKLTIPAAIRPKMKDYGIKQESEGLLSWDFVREQLEKSMNYWLATSRPNGNPHAAPVWGVLFEDVVYFGTGETSRKARNFKHNPNVVLHTESGFDTVIVEGKIKKLAERALYDDIAPVYAMKYAPHNYEPTAEELAKGGLYRVVPAIVMAWKESDFPNTATRWEFS